MEIVGSHNIQAEGSVTVNQKVDRRKLVRRKEDRVSALLKALLIVQSCITLLLLLITFRQTNLTQEIQTFNQFIEYQDNRIVKVEKFLQDQTKEGSSLDNYSSLEDWHREQHRIKGQGKKGETF